MLLNIPRRAQRSNDIAGLLKRSCSNKILLQQLYNNRRLIVLSNIPLFIITNRTGSVHLNHHKIFSN